MINRYVLTQIKNDFNKRKILILYGARQVGKTTLVKQFLNQEGVYYNCDLDEVQNQLSKHNLSILGGLIGNHKTVVIDEAQRVKNIGLTLKILIDHFPTVNFLVTGSSAFELADTINEPLTGRCFIHPIYPIAECELAATINPITLNEGLEHRLIYGSYPEILINNSISNKQRLIEHIAEYYLFKDILKMESIKNTALLERILKALAFQIGSEVSLNELAQLVDADKNTVKKYLDICEKLFIIFSISPLQGNKRNAITKLKKYYFYDLGIRNALVRQFQPLDLRNDIGALWENYFIIERIKFNHSRQFYPNYYFFRSYQGQEIDFIEEYNNELNAFECKWSKLPNPTRIKKVFTVDIGGKDLFIVNKTNYTSFVR